MDDGLGGNFVTLVGGPNDTPYLLQVLTASQDIVKGRLYRFRYRAQNCHGWGPVSPILYALAASIPQAPPALTVTQISAT